MLAIGIELLEDYTKELERRLKELEKQEVFIGVKAEQGTHQPSGLNYTDLLWIHDIGSSKLPARPVAEWTLLSFNKDKTLRDGLKKFLSDIDKPSSPISAKEAVTPFTNAMWRAGYNVFGNLNYLESNAEYTIDRKGFNSPLIETGELRDQWSVYINDTKVK